MILLICIDDKDGMMFARRRQSKDGVLRRRMLSLSEEKLFVSPYSAKQFEETGFVTADNPAKAAGQGEYAFIEDTPLPREDVERIILYRWNRRYPGDRFFDRSLLDGRKKISETDFAGSSHEKITEEIWE